MAAGETDEADRLVTLLPPLVDAVGWPLCSHAVWGRRCRWKKVCSFSHDVTPELLGANRRHAERQDVEVQARRIANIPEVVVPPWLRALQLAPGAFQYDIARWPLAQLVWHLLATDTNGHATAFAPCGGESQALARLHEQSVDGEPPLCMVMLEAHAARRGSDSLPSSWRKLMSNSKLARTTMYRSLAYQAFLKVYLDFCAEVLLPLLGSTSAYIQCPPTLRVHLAGQAAASGRIGMHKDADYPGHCPAEVNFWVPMTDVGGCNSLYVESGEGRGDFSPLKLRYGEVFRFYGYGCQHHTVTNESNESRVSFDLRAIPSSVCEDQALRGWRRTGLRIGDYPALLIEAQQAGSSITAEAQSAAHQSAAEAIA